MLSLFSRLKASFRGTPPGEMVNFDFITPTFEGAIPSMSKVADELKRQTHPHWHWLLCANGESQALQDFVKGQDDPRIQLFEAPHQATDSMPLLLASISARRIFCMDRANSRFMIWLDSDIKILREDFLFVLGRAILAHPEQDVFLYNIYHSGVRKTLPRFPMKYGRIDLANYCVRASFAREVGWPEDPDWQRIKAGEIPFQHKDFRFFQAMMAANGGRFHHLKRRTFLAWNGNASYETLSDRSGELAKGLQTL